MSEEKKNPRVIRLDGSHGTGLECLVTIIKSDKVTGVKEITYTLPFVLVDFDTLHKHLVSNMILGYRVEKIIPPDQQAIVLTVTPDGIRSELEGENEADQ